MMRLFKWLVILKPKTQQSELLRFHKGFISTKTNNEWNVLLQHHSITLTQWRECLFVNNLSTRTLSGRHCFNVPLLQLLLLAQPLGWRPAGETEGESFTLAPTTQKKMLSQTLSLNLQTNILPQNLSVPHTFNTMACLHLQAARELSDL